MPLNVPADMPRGVLARRLLGLVAPHWLRLTVAGLLLVAASLTGLALPWAVRDLVDTIFVTADVARLDRLALGLLALFAAQMALSLGHAYLLAEVGQRMVADLRRQVHAQLTNLPLRFFAERRTGELISRLGADAAVVQAALTDLPISLLRQVITLVGGLVLMLLLNWQLTLLMLGLIPPVLAAGLFFGSRVQRLSMVVHDRLAGTMVVLEEMLSGIRVVKSFAREPYEHTRYAGQVEQTYVAAMRHARVQAAFGPLIGLLGFGALTVLLWYGGRQVLLGAITAGDLIALLFYMMMVAGPLGELAGLYTRLRGALGAGQRLFEILNAVPEPVTEAGVGSMPRLRGHVRLAGVSFAYADGPPVLDGIDLTVAPGEVVALVGPSGVGKTTLVNLIARLYEPTVGRVEIDGRDARAYDLRGLREQIGLVPQETFLFGGTVRENIAYGRLAADEAAIVAAARAANAHDFIAALPEGYETIVGEKGVRLSMGQRQRVAIARALLKDPRILILDEATSSLDAESERLVQEALDRLLVGRTAFIIAHRLSTIRQASRIVVLRDGHIVEEGRHDDLLARQGLYARLWALHAAAPSSLALTGADGA